MQVWAPLWGVGHPGALAVVVPPSSVLCRGAAAVRPFLWQPERRSCHRSALGSSGDAPVLQLCREQGAGLHRGQGRWL